MNGSCKWRRRTITTKTQRHKLRKAFNIRSWTFCLGAFVVKPVSLAGALFFLAS
jgi:hypothetical protein